MFLEKFVEFLIVMAAVFGLTVLISRFVIPILKSHKLGQKILDIGPRWHKSKEGTPTMGGICFIMAILVVIAIVAVASAFRGNAGELIPLALTLSLGVANGMIGFFDDYRKLIKRQNEGLKPYEKIILQTIAAALYIYAMVATNNISTELHIPFTQISLELGGIYYIFALVLIVGIVNGVNLTDGIDGLASTVTFVVGGFFAVLAFAGNPEKIINDRSLYLIAAALIGGTVGFLVYNFHPAKVFMGDTGSLFLGGVVVGAVFMINEPLIVLLVGIVYILEALSDIIQVGVYKISGKKVRVFKMAPIHHHFEQCGWSENKIVLSFSLLTLVFCVVAFFAFI